MIHPVEIQNLFQRALPESVVKPNDTTQRGSSYSPANEPSTSLSTANKQALNQQLLRSVSDALAVEGVSLNGLYPEDVTPEKTANTILGFVSSLYAGFVGEGGRSDAEINNFFDQIRSGVEKGFSEARGILDSLGVLNGDIASNIDKTYDLVQTGIDNLQNPPESVENTLVQSASLSSASYDRSEDTSIEITTREGDVVTINIEKDAGASQSNFQTQNSDGLVTGASSSQYASVNLSYSVEGDLNAEEFAAIEDLVGRIDKVSDKFFSGNLVAAFNQAKNIGYDSDQIVAFSVDLSYEQTTRTVSAYQQTRQADTDNNPNDESAEQSASLPALVNATHDIGNIINDAKDLLQDPAKNVGQLIKEFAHARENNNNDSPLKQLEAQANSLLNDVVDQLIESLLKLEA